MTDFTERYGPWAVVTGAAAGVGYAFAEELVERGLGVVLVDVSPTVDEVAKVLTGDTRALVADVSDPGWIDSLATVTTGLEIGLAVANAGISFVGRYLDMDTALRRRMLAVNCQATADLASWAVPPMVDRGRGGFVAMSSGSALAGTGGVGLYSATKAFAVNFVEALGWEIASSGVTTLAICAPSMNTPAFVGHNPDYDAMASPMVEPRTVVAAALDELGTGGRWLGDAGMAMLETLPRAQTVDIMSTITTGMYPTIFPRN